MQKYKKCTISHRKGSNCVKPLHNYHIQKTGHKQTGLCVHTQFYFLPTTVSGIVSFLRHFILIINISKRCAFTNFSNFLVSMWWAMNWSITLTVTVISLWNNRCMQQSEWACIGTTLSQCFCPCMFLSASNHCPSHHCLSHTCRWWRNHLCS